MCVGGCRECFLSLREVGGGGHIRTGAERNGSPSDLTRQVACLVAVTRVYPVWICPLSLLVGIPWRTGGTVGQHGSEVT